MKTLLTLLLALGIAGGGCMAAEGILAATGESVPVEEQIDLGTPEGLAKAAKIIAEASRQQPGPAGVAGGSIAGILAGTAGIWGVINEVRRILAQKKAQANGNTAKTLLAQVTYLISLLPKDQQITALDLLAKQQDATGTRDAVRAALDNKPL